MSRYRSVATTLWHGLKKLNIVYWKSDGVSFVTYCPSCTDRSGHCEIHTMERIWHCHRCGSSGKLPGFVVVPPPKRSPPRGHRGKGRSALWLAGADPGAADIPESPGKGRSDTSSGLPGASPGALTPFLEPPGPRQTNYLSGRGLSPEQIALLDPRSGRDKWMTYLPIKDLSGNVVYVVGRVTVRAKQRYWYPSHTLTGGIGKSHVLWWRLRMPQSVTVCEGILDAIWFPDGVAVLGTTISKAQIALISHLSPNVINVALDGDAYVKGQSHDMAYRLARAFPAKQVIVWQLPADKDPCDLRGDLSKCHKEVI